MNDLRPIRQRTPRHTQLSRARHPPNLGAIISDVDGTVARRNQLIGPRVASALAEAAAVGWQIIMLTGQPFSNVWPRIVPQLTAALRRVPGALGRIRILTCEGATEWRFHRQRWSPLRTTTADPNRLSEQERRRITRLLLFHLRELLPPGVRLLQAPSWLEKAMLILKLDAAPPQRCLVATRLATLFRQHAIGTLRVGLGGTFSVVIAHQSLHKGKTLERIVQELRPGEQAFYLADEFTENGNDLGALQVKRLVCVDFRGAHPKGGSGVQSGGGRGPRAVERWLLDFVRTQGHLRQGQLWHWSARMTRMRSQAGNRRPSQLVGIHASQALRRR